MFGSRAQLSTALLADGAHVTAAATANGLAETNRVLPLLSAPAVPTPDNVWNVFQGNLTAASSPLDNTQGSGICSVRVHNSLPPSWPTEPMSPPPPPPTASRRPTGSCPFSPRPRSPPQTMSGTFFRATSPPPARR